MFSKMKKAFDNNSYVVVTLDNGDTYTGKLQGVMDCGILIGKDDDYLGFYRISKIVVKD